MFEVQLYAKDSQGSTQAVSINPDGQIVSAPTAAIGDVSSGSTDSGNPVKIGGIARTVNPTAVTDGQRVNASFDKLGRQLIVPYQMRELLKTAYATLTPGSGGNTETTLISGIAGTFLDLYQITCANTSTAALGATTAIRLDIRDATAGGIVATMMVNDDDMRTITFNPPLPQGNSGNNWTVQAGTDLSTGNPVTISAQFVQNT